jgi:NDP-sugar pyrophosphorylase family protein
MKAVILAAGKGTRMQPLTFERPKPLVEVLGKSLLDHMIDILPSEVDELVLVIGYMGEMIREHIGAEWKGKPVIYIEQEEQNGPAKALHLVRSHIAEGERFFFLFSDDIYDKESLAKMLQHPRAILVAPVENPERFGVVLMDDQNRILDIEEKPKVPKSNLAVTGVYLFDAHIFDYELQPHTSGEYFLPPIMLAMNKDYPLFVEQASLWIPIGYPEDLQKAEAILKNRAANAE